MKYYLEMDGVDDGVIAGQGLEFDYVEMDFYIYSDSFGYIADWRTAVSNSQIEILDDGEGGQVLKAAPVTSRTHTLDGLPANAMKGVPVEGDKRYLLGITMMEGPENGGSNFRFFFPRIASQPRAKGRLYDIKIYNSSTLIAHYDFTQGDIGQTNQIIDVSGNNNHGAMLGGTWVEDTEQSEPDYPEVQIVSVSNYRLSGKPEHDLSTVKFKFNKDVKEYVVKVEGTSHETGDTAYIFIGDLPQGEEATGIVSWDDLKAEGANRINIYGRDADDNWTPYS